MDADVEGPRGRLMRGSDWHPDWKLEGKMIGSSGWVLGSFTLMGLRVSLVFRILGETVLFVSKKKMLANNISPGSCKL